MEIKKWLKKFFFINFSFVLHLTSVSGADWNLFSEPYSMINLLNLNIYKIFHFCPNMIFDQILNGTPIFFSKFEDQWTGDFFPACQYHWECRKSSEKDREHTVFILLTSTCGCPPMMTEVFKKRYKSRNWLQTIKFWTHFQKNWLFLISGQYFIEF